MSRKTQRTAHKQSALIQEANKVMDFLPRPEMIHVSSTAPDGCLSVRVEAREEDGSMGVALGHPLLEEFKDELRGRGVRVFDAEADFDAAVREARGEA